MCNLLSQTAWVTSTSFFVSASSSTYMPPGPHRSLYTPNQHSSEKPPQEFMSPHLRSKLLVVAAHAVSSLGEQVSGSIWRGRCSVRHRWVLQCHWGKFWEYQTLLDCCWYQNLPPVRSLCAFLMLPFKLTTFLKSLLVNLSYCLIQLIVIWSQISFLNFHLASSVFG